MKQLLSLLFLVFSLANACAQDKKALKYAKTITEADLKSRLSVLAADSLEGRETGKRGQKIAAQYLKEQFKSFGLVPVVPTENGKSYIQNYPLQSSIIREGYFKKGEEVKVNFEDYLYYSRQATEGEEEVEIIFLGNKSIDDLKAMDVEGKFVAIRSKEGSVSTLLPQLKELNTEGIMMIVEDESRFGMLMSIYGKRMKTTKLSLDTINSTNKIIFGTPELLSWIFGEPYDSLVLSETEKSAKVLLNAKMQLEVINAENVLGFIEGTEKPEEVLVISAHYDHIGIEANGDINNGADDDGSGTSTVLEIAQAFSEAAKAGIKPKRSILFLLVSGEEKGLLGSEYYTLNPIFPMANTVTNLNVDMVGRTDPSHEEKADYIYVIGADRLSQELQDISEKINQTYVNLDLDYTYNDEKDPNRYYFRSDHYNFAEKGVPIIFYFNGTHADYHKSTDTIEKIEFDHMRKRALLVFHTAWELANREDRVKLK
ncbi:MAG: hypothetical protein ACI83W_000394 [Marinoscillum sp.]|jgi:hypothetical protein